MTDGYARSGGNGGKASSSNSKRGLLASLWSLMTILTAISFLSAFIFALSTKNYDGDEDYNQYNNRYNNNNNDNDSGSQDEQQQENDSRYDYPEVAVTSRALAFSALWTGVLAVLLSVFGTVILGWQSPTGLYYTCCSSSVHRTTPLGIGSFIGALLMFANLTLVCSVLFGEFEIRDSREGDDRSGAGDDANQFYGQRENKSMAFSYMCMVLTVLYAGFAALTLTYATDVIDEHSIDERDDMATNIMMTSTNRMNINKTTVGHFNAHAGYDGYIGGEAINHNRNVVGYDGYIGERFDVVGHRPRNGPAGFVSTTTPDATLA